ncbi:hypothetical protein [Aliiroseovarius sediminis]|uniref:hypothetical protein n=1 Tax=Aliiroseovarius sediminis TaxID=2925839 RepID=UPI001F592524|nr:hypothetical protein [Aliiroseovarius sediminis]MCI2395708.1 hypothetical protein [Aliiroseovarius sediminis]
MPAGKANIVTKFVFLTLFMLYGFVLIFLRDFAPGKELRIAGGVSMVLAVGWRAGAVWRQESLQ